MTISNNIQFPPNFNNPSDLFLFHRSDADIQTYYALLRKRPTPPVRNYTEIIKTKTKTAAWIVSHYQTQSERGRYVKELQKYIDVDVYGTGAPHNCPRSFDEMCSKMISTKYKFYLGFENSLCDDYVTEKFYKYFSLDVVLVARAADLVNIAPPETFVNTAHFRSPKQLAERLVYLSEHEEEYVEILREKDRYFTMFEEYVLKNEYRENRYEAIPFCQLCQRLWNVDKYSKIVKDINIWFNSTKCYPPNDLS